MRFKTKALNIEMSFTNVIRNAKCRHILQNIEFSSSSSTWKFLGTLGMGKKQHSVFNSTIGLTDIDRYFTSTTLDLHPIHFVFIHSNAVGCDGITTNDV